MFSGSYRLCDVDDLIANTLGGIIGYAVVKMAERVVPAIEAFDKNIVFVFNKSMSYNKSI